MVGDRLLTNQLRALHWDVIINTFYCIPYSFALVHLWDLGHTQNSRVYGCLIAPFLTVTRNAMKCNPLLLKFGFKDWVPISTSGEVSVLPVSVGYCFADDVRRHAVQVRNRYSPHDACTCFEIMPPSFKPPSFRRRCSIWLAWKSSACLVRSAPPARQESPHHHLQTLQLCKTAPTGLPGHDAMVTYSLSFECTPK